MLKLPAHGAFIWPQTRRGEPFSKDRYELIKESPVLRYFPVTLSAKSCDADPFSDFIKIECGSIIFYLKNREKEEDTNKKTKNSVAHLKIIHMIHKQATELLPEVSSGTTREKARILEGTEHITLNLSKKRVVIRECSDITDKFKIYRLKKALADLSKDCFYESETAS